MSWQTTVQKDLKLMEMIRDWEEAGRQWRTSLCGETVLPNVLEARDGLRSASREILKKINVDIVIFFLYLMFSVNTTVH